jgi:hypothetical protein
MNTINEFLVIIRMSKGLLNAAMAEAAVMPRPEPK